MYSQTRVCVYLSQCAELHDDPDRIICDDSHQLHNVGMVKLTHGHYEDKQRVTVV